MKAICGLDCDKCENKHNCSGCMEINKNPEQYACIVARCSKNKGCGRCDDCTERCRLKEELIAEFNALGIEDMPEVTGLNEMIGSYINLEYTLPNGQAIRLLEEDKVYLGNQMEKAGSSRCYGLAADEQMLLVCEYGENGTEAEIVVYQRRNRGA